MKWKKEIEKRLDRLECEHDFSYKVRPLLRSKVFSKVCKHCGKAIVISEEAWLQEQADLCYELHEMFIDKLNEYYQLIEKPIGQ